MFVLSVYVLQSLGPAPAVTPGEPEGPQRPADLVISGIPSDPSLSPSSDGADMTCCDLLSLRSDSLSLASEATISRTVREQHLSSSSSSNLLQDFYTHLLNIIKPEMFCTSLWKV